MSEEFEVPELSDDPTPDERAEFVILRLEQFIRDGRKVAQGSEAGMQKLQQAIEKFNQDNGTNLKAETTMGKHDPDFERTGVRTDEQEVFVTISSEG